MNPVNLSFSFFGRLLLPCALLWFSFSSLSGQTYPRNTPPPAANPAFGQPCPLRVIMILDESGSLGPNGSNSYPLVRAAVQSYMSAVNGTGTELAIIEFSSTASIYPINGSTAMQAVDNSFISSATNFLNNNYGSQGNTFWNLALREALSINNAAAANETADLIIFFTDGNPYPLGGSRQTNLQEAILHANTLKGQSTRMLVLGVGNNINETYIHWISGTNKYTQGSDIKLADYIIEPNLSNIVASFNQIATEFQTTYYADDDGDGLGDPNNSVQACEPPSTGNWVEESAGEDNCPGVSNPGQEDADGDGIGDICDDCPNDPNNDEDGDNVCGDLDNCPSVPNTQQEDQDGDNVGDACDECPNDPNKALAGFCGCGNPETDTDNDGTPDCVDQCPNDPNKTAPGNCGCGAPEDPNTMWYLDADNDDYYTGSVVIQCGSPGPGYRFSGILGGNDCDDSDPAIHPGASEVCNGLDDDCDLVPDDGLVFINYYPDADGDGFGDANSAPVPTCDGPPADHVADNSDCNDATADIHPNTQWFLDADGDGYTVGAAIVQCTSPGQDYRYSGILGGNDCDDSDPAVNPGATEVCNGKDDDCQNGADDGLTFTDYYPDGDGDGFGDANANPTSTCDGAPNGMVADNGDCDDTDAEINPNTQWFLDADGDGYTVGAASVQCTSPGQDYRYNGILGGNDCDDSNLGINPGATEVCNGLDDDCQNGADDGLTFTDYYPDADGDGFGDASANATSTCYGAPNGMVADNSDCNDSDQALNPNTQWFLDADGDGYTVGAAIVQCTSPGQDYRYNGILGGSDCDDSNPAIHPGASEVCNGLDDDCQNGVDDGLTFTDYYPDTDGDGFGDANANPVASCDGPPADHVTNNSDCNDADGDIHPNTQWYLDADGDGYTVGAAIVQCTSPGQDYRYNGIQGGLDCNDADPAINPGASEICNGIDDNCNTAIDEGLRISTFYPDADNDGFGDAFAAPFVTCDIFPPNGMTADNSDCDDALAAVNPDTQWFLDADGDGYTVGVAIVQCASPGQDYRYSGILGGNDCNDSDPAINPGSVEICNSVDDDCDGIVDEDDVCCPDNDGDGFTDSSCGGTDCDDSDNTVYPGAPEICDGKDNDCNGLADDGLPFTDYFPDADGDGYGDSGANPTSTCDGPPAGHVTDNSDCNDNDPEEYPGQTWFADLDGDQYSDGTTLTQCDRPTGYKLLSELSGTGYDDCDDSDENEFPGQYWHLDADGDGYGNGQQTLIQCARPSSNYYHAGELIAVSGDCDDNDADEFPGQTWFEDLDGDGYSSGVTKTQCTRPNAHYLTSELVASSGDCNDADATIYPGAPELCDGLDNDCDGTVPADETDNDGDGYATCQGDCNDSDATIYPGAPELCDGLDNDCDGNVPTDETDDDGDGFAECQGDCNDADAAIYPGASEICDGIDNNCDGSIDEGLLNTYYADNDGDGYGDPNNSLQDCSAPSGYVADNSDCDDTNGAVNPGAQEVCNGIDDDCDGQVDNVPAPPTWYADSDGDGYGDPNNSLLDCNQPAGYTADNSDCDDTDPNVHPGATEICDGIDNNCDGNIDESCCEPTNLTATQQSADEVLLDWDDDGTAAGFEIEHRETGGTWSTATSSVSEYLLTGLNSGVTYEFRVRTDCGSGSYSPWTPIQSFTTSGCGAPGLYYVRVYTRYNRAYVRWYPETGASNYHIRFRVTGSNNWTSLTTSTTYLFLNNLSGGSTYEFQLAATCPYGQSAWGALHTFSLGAPKPGSKGGGDDNWSDEDLLFLTATKMEGEVRLNWIDPIPGENGLFLIEKAVYGGQFETIALLELDPEIDWFQWTDTDPREGDNHYRVRKITDSNGLGLSSSIKSIYFDLRPFDFQVYPNPANTQFQVYLKEFAGKEVTLVLTNALGSQLLRLEDLTVEHSFYTVQLDRSVTPGGIYIVSIVYKGEAYSKRLMIAD